MKSYFCPMGQVDSTIIQFLHSKYLLHSRGLGILMPRFRQPLLVGGGFGSYLQQGANALRVHIFRKQL